MPPLPEQERKNLITLLCAVHSGKMRIPDFQREFVWTPDQVQELLDSIGNGYPIGSVLIWETTERLHSLDPAGLQLREPVPETEIQYLLDGQQGLMSLYMTFRNSVKVGKRRRNEYRAFYDLSARKFDLINKSDSVKIAAALANRNVVPVDELVEISWDSGNATTGRNAISRIMGLANSLNSSSRCWRSIKD